MNRVRMFAMSGAAFTLAAVVAGNIPIASAEENTSPTGKPHARSERMHAGRSAAPLISMALRHRAELNLAGDQIASLDKIKSHYDSQVAPLHAEWSAIEEEIAALMQK